MTHRRMNVAKKLLLGVLTTSSIVSMIMTVLQITFEYQKKKSQLEAVITSVENSTLQFLGERLWNLDYKAIPDQFKPMLENLDIAGVRLVNENDLIVYAGSRPDFTPEYPVKRSFPIYYRAADKNVKVGNLELVFFLDRLVTELRYSFMILLGFNLAKAIIVSLLLLALFSRLVTKPLAEMVEFFNSHSIGIYSSSEPLKLSRHSEYADEISDLAGYISKYELNRIAYSNRQSRTIEEQSKALVAIDEALKMERARNEMNARLAQLGEMAAGIAHEISNPLQILYGLSQHMRDELDKEVSDKTLLLQNNQALENMVGRISKIVQSLLIYGHDGVHDPFETLPVSEIFTQLSNLVGSKFKNRQIEFTLQIDCNIDTKISVRSAQIVQALVSLAQNSFEAVQSLNQPWIKISASEQGRHLKISIEDSGQGIEQSIARKIFEPFFTTKDSGVATGIGLSIAHSIIQEHQGSLGLDGKSAHTKFDVLLPIAEVAPSV